MFWLIFSLIVFILAFYGEEKKERDKHVVVFSRISLVFVLAYAVALCGEGQDKDNYLLLYDLKLSNYNFDNLWEWIGLADGSVEIGFIILCRICKLFGLSAMGMLFVVSILTNALVVTAFYRFRFPILVFFLYILSLFYLQQTNLVRQMLAVSICLYSLRYVTEGKLNIFLVGLLCAFLIHKSSFLLLIFIPFCFHDKISIQTTKIVLLVVWGVSVLAALNILPIGSLISLNGLSNTRYSMYLGANIDLGVHDLHFEWLYNLFVLFYLLFGRCDKDKIIYPVFFVLGCVVLNFALSIIIIQRLSFYFTPLYCAFLPTLMVDNNLIKSKKMTEKYLMFAVFVFYHVRSLYSHITEGFEQIGGHFDSLSAIFN